MKNHNFHAILKEIGDLHDQKNKDYGHEHDPYANVRGSTDWGVESWKGSMIRANDKMKRLQKFAKDGYLANESVEDSFKDLAVYALIALDLFRQELTAKKSIVLVDPGDPGDGHLSEEKIQELIQRQHEQLKSMHRDPGDETDGLPVSIVHETDYERDKREGITRRYHYNPDGSRGMKQAWADPHP